MEYLHNGFTLEIPEGCFPLSTDSMILADFVRLTKNAKVLDLGSGCGTLGLLLCAASSTCSVVGLELDENAHEAACRNITANRLEKRMKSLRGDLRNCTGAHFSHCVSNPPYFTGGAPGKTNPTARQDTCCTTEDLMSCAARHLQFGGDFFVVQKPEALGHLCAMGAKYDLEPKRLRLVRHSPESPVSLIVLQLRKGGKPGLTWEELTLHNADGTFTKDYNRIYHIQEG